jgi:hypothetical protein
MRKDTQPERLQLASLKQLDALIGKYLTKETPQVFWEEPEACLRFDSLQEAIEAMRDPYFQEFIPKEARPHSALTEVQEFRPYSADLNVAWELVDQLSAEAGTFHVKREDGQWLMAFGDRPVVVSRLAPLAICLAALRARGIEVDLAEEATPSLPVSRVAA